MILKDRSARKNVILIFLCFLLGSTIHLAWLYHLISLTPGILPDILTMICGYLMQAAGVFIFAWICRSFPSLINPHSLAGVLVLNMIFLVPALVSPGIAGSAVFGLIDSILCGVTAGYYLLMLASEVNEEMRAGVFGTGYAAATILTWLFSIPGSGAVYQPRIVLPLCMVMTCAIIAVCRKTEPEEPEEEQALPVPRSYRTIILIFFVVFLFSLVNNMGFSFPSADIENGISLELSRVFYAVGLLIAGTLTDYNRRYGSVCALAALVMPFILLALKGEPISSMLFWALSYFAFGFYSVYRIVLFSDYAASKNILYLSGGGLLAGRLGDAAGKGICMALSGHTAALVSAAAVLFVISVIFFFRLYRKLYMPKEEQLKTEKEIFHEFSVKHDLSSREREVLHLLLEEKSNSQIAELLYVSESTVKYHVHNLLKKTGCRNRTELKSVYFAGNKGT